MVMTTAIMDTTIMISMRVKAGVRWPDAGDWLRVGEACCVLRVACLVNGTRNTQHATPAADFGLWTLDFRLITSPRDIGGNCEHSGKHANQEERDAECHDNDQCWFDHVGHDPQGHSPHRPAPE